MFQSLLRMCRFVVKPDCQELKPAEEEFVMGLEGVVIGFVTAILVFRFVGHILIPLIRG